MNAPVTTVPLILPLCGFQSTCSDNIVLIVVLLFLLPLYLSLEISCLLSGWAEGLWEWWVHYAHSYMCRCYSVKHVYIFKHVTCCCPLEWRAGQKVLGGWKKGSHQGTSSHLAPGVTGKQHPKLQPPHPLLHLCLPQFFPFTKHSHSIPLWWHWHPPDSSFFILPNMARSSF